MFEVVDAFFQEVGAPFAATLEQRQRVAGLRVLAEDDDADVRMRPPELFRCADPLVDAGRRHADVGDDDVGPFGLHGLKQFVEVAAGGHDLEVGLRLEQAPHPLAHEVVVVGEHDSQRHGVRIRPRRGGRYPADPHWIGMLTPWTSA